MLNRNEFAAVIEPQIKTSNFKISYSSVSITQVQIYTKKKL